MIYLCSTLKHAWNVEFNPKLAAALEAAGVKVYLPQRDTPQEDPHVIIEKNFQAMDAASHILAVAKHPSPNWGIEVGYAIGKGIPVLVLAEHPEDIPVMCREHVDALLVEDLDEISAYSKELTATIIG